MPKKRKMGGKTGGDGDAKKKKSKSFKSKDDVPEYASDDDRFYGNQDSPDPESREYFFDDIDEFHASKEKILLEKSYKADDVAEYTDEEEVLALDSEESDDEEIRNLKAQLRKVKQLQTKETIDSDMEDKDEDVEEDYLPNKQAWGNRRSRYYGDDDDETVQVDDDEEENLDEKEVLRLQKEMSEQLDDQDFGLDIFKPSETMKTQTVEKEEKIIKDLSKLSRKEKLKLLKEESPELLPLIDDFKLKMTELLEKLCPLKEWIERKEIKGPAADYVCTKLRLNLIYCTNVAFYLMLKAKKVAVHSHPVMKRLLQFRNIMVQLQPIDDQMKDEIEEILENLKKGVDLELTRTVEQPKSFVKRQKTQKSALRQKKKLSDLTVESDSEASEPTKKEKRKTHTDESYETKDEKAALEYYNMMKDGRPEKSDDEIEEDVQSDEDIDEFGEGSEEEDENSKRAISYQIEKNKGLTAHKKKELRNPRVKHRMKYRKAKIRRKGQFREPRTEMQKYGGELSGIRAGVKRGVKLK